MKLFLQHSPLMGAISADKLASYSQKESKLVFENWKEAIDTKVEMIAENDVLS